jgi:hypothetical protein
MVGLFFDDNISIFILSIFFTILGVAISYVLNIEGDIKNSIYLFLLFFAIYLLYTLVITLGLIEMYGVKNIKGDELFFYTASNDVYIKLKNGYSFFDIANIIQYGDTSGAVYFYGIIATIANIYGENSVLVQKVGVVFISSLIPMVMYGISRLYFSEKISITVAILYGLFSFVPYLSSTLLRDIHIALMFILTIYIILQKLSILNLIILFCISFSSYYLREQTGLFMMGFTMIYFFVFVNFFVKNRYIVYLIYTVFLSIAIIVILNSSIMDMIELISNSSAKRSVEQATSGSMGAKIAKLPYGLNIIALLGFSQIQPFPPSWIFDKSNKGILELSYLIAAIIWFFGWGFLLYGLFFKNILNRVDLKLKLMSLFSIVYLVLIAVIDFSQRRQMPVYPMLYLIMVFSYLEMTITERTKIWVGMSILYITLVLTINYIKI